ncbi:hypothetical protein OA328_03635 [Paracoccaceae bacterium]|nr:hypothetical protein [Paracoccaceae bacterium]
MQIQDISLTQIIVVLIFLGILIVLQQLLKNNKFSFQNHLNKNKRIKFIDDFGLSSTERVRLIRVDDKEYLYFSAKGSSPTVIPHEGKSKANIKRNMEFKKLTSNENDEIGAQEKAKGKTNILSDAIHNARKMNPKLGFKR